MLCAMSKWLALAMLVLATPAGAEPLAVGSDVAAFSLEDQFGVVHTVDESVRAIVFAREMEGGEIVKEALVEVGAVLLAEADAVYVADVSGMPSLIRRMFALPKMRKRDYRVLLDTEGSITADFPGREGEATLIQLDASRVSDISHYASMTALQEGLRSLSHESAAE